MVSVALKSLTECLKNERVLCFVFSETGVANEKRVDHKIQC